MRIKISLLVLACFLVLNLTACNKDTTPDPNQALVLVNGEPITQAEFEEEYDESLALIEAHGTVMTPTLKEQLRDDVLDTLVRNKLLIQYADADDYAPSEADVDSLYQYYVTQYGGEAALEEVLAEQSYTLDDLRDDLVLQINIDHFLNAYIDAHGLANQIVVTDAEIEEAFLQFVIESGQQDLVLSDYYEAIKYSIEEEKMIALVNVITDDLIEESEIEYLDETK